MKVDEDNIVEREASAVGWAVFSGCEGEEPTPVAGGGPLRSRRLLGCA